MDNMRIATAPLPTVDVVCPRGEIREVPIADNINNLVTTPDGRIQDEAASEGWMTLEDAYAAEGFDAGWRTWCERRDAKRAGQRCEKLADEWLPQLVLDRRARVQTGLAWKAPPAPTRKKAKAS